MFAYTKPNGSVVQRTGMEWTTARLKFPVLVLKHLCKGHGQPHKKRGVAMKKSVRY